jgi:hypothetical protein
MSGIQKKKAITDTEWRAINNLDTLYPPKTGNLVHNPEMQTKILLSILECMQEMKEELAQMRQTNERIASKIERSFTGESVRVYNTN